MRLRRIFPCALATWITLAAGCAPERMSAGDRAAQNARDEHARAREQSGGAQDNHEPRPKRRSP